MHEMEQINRRTWGSPIARRDYRKSSGYLNDGERVVLDVARKHGSGGRILDIGVGGGRTAALLSDIAKEYVGIDYTPEMVTLARSNYPGIHFEHMDARDLSAFTGCSFDVVVFSYNGIDSVDAEGRKAIFAEISRVLKPGGAFVFSTFNRNWRGFGENRARSSIVWSGDPLRLSFRLFKHAVGLVRERRFAPLELREGEHAILLHHAHDFGLMIYATTPGQLRSQLSASGFESEPMLFSVDGQRLGGETMPHEEYFHVVAYKPALSYSAGKALDKERWLVAGARSTIGLLRRDGAGWLMSNSKQQGADYDISCNQYGHLDAHGENSVFAYNAGLLSKFLCQQSGIVTR